MRWLNWLILSALVLGGCTATPSRGKHHKQCFDDGTCLGDLFCSEDGICLEPWEDCIDRACGPSPHVGYDCGTCPGEFEYCTDAGRCEDDCAGRECGESPTGRFDCGSCPGATDICDAAGRCIDDCAGRSCGPSPNAGYDCGACQGAGEHCTPEGACCPEGHTGADCSACQEHYQDNDGDGICMPDCQLAALDCHGHGSCEDESGTAVCVCRGEYDPETDCAECKPGLQDNDGDGTCMPDCATAAPDCPEHEHCEDASGVVTCVCDEAYHDFGQGCVLFWVRVEGGTYLMGSDAADADGDEQPVHEVTVPSFYISRTEVTVAQYERCFDQGVCGDMNMHETCNLPMAESDADLLDHPVNCIVQGDPDHAPAFCAWLEEGSRLPSEAEWEYAARSGGLDVLYPWGESVPGCDLVVWDEGGSPTSAGCGRDSTWPVCSRPDGNSELGLCDMAGNLAELVRDRYHDSYEGAPVDGSAWEPDSGYRVLRGGSYTTTDPLGLRTTARIENVVLKETIGFRCVKPAE